MNSQEPIAELVRVLSNHRFEVRPVTRDFPLTEPINPTMMIRTPDGRLELFVRESDYLADPDGLVSRLRHHLRTSGYAC